MVKKIVLFFLITLNHLITNALPINNKPLQILANPNESFGFITGVDFKPNSKIFAVTYFQNQKVIIYTLQDNGVPKVLQILKNPLSELSLPHGIAFHPAGNFMAVTNYGNSTISIFEWNLEKNNFIKKPVSVFTFPAVFKVHASHGIAFSSKGDCLAVTFCDCDEKFGYEEKVIFFPFNQDIGKINPEPFFILHGVKAQFGNPKGVAFSPDGNSIIITMCDANTLLVYDFIDKEKYQMNLKPRQIIKNPEAQLYRPEDVKFSPDGTIIGVTNSNHNTVTLYGYDKKHNIIFPNAPIHILKNPESQLMYPHGLAFSPDGKFLTITHFGVPDGPQVEISNKRGDKVTIYGFEKDKKI